ncbi:MAG TPA: hypothetical protein VFQ78_02035 [Candidatus Udaeobacter sp.]|jgi:hypothetical protein|nr:hypothetical protein [Candidatus Udaeobacter sp.]
MTSLSETRAELDAITADIELTLVSIIQGVALTVLIETSREAIAKLDWMMWPYVLSGLVIILVFWSRVVLHILTVIRWPLEFGHNFLYIACALVEALSFAQLGNPGRWFAFVAAFLAVGCSLFAYDLRLIQMRIQDHTGDASNRLYTLVRRDQWLNIGLLLPAFFLVNVGCAVAIHSRPEFFLARDGHIWLIALQLIAFAGYLSYVLFFYTKLAPLIMLARAEWRTKSRARETSP